MASELQRRKFEQENEIPIEKLPNARTVGDFLVPGYCKYCGKSLGKAVIDVDGGYYHHYCRERGGILDKLIEEQG